MQRCDHGIRVVCYLLLSEPSFEAFSYKKHTFFGREVPVASLP